MIIIITTISRKRIVAKLLNLSQPQATRRDGALIFFSQTHISHVVALLCKSIIEATRNNSEIKIRHKDRFGCCQLDNLHKILLIYRCCCCCCRSAKCLFLSIKIIDDYLSRAFAFSQDLLSNVVSRPNLVQVTKAVEIQI